LAGPEPGELSEDPYLWLEDLKDERVLAWIERENARTREILGDLPGKLFERVLAYFSLPYLLSAVVTKRGYLALYREGGSYKVVLLGRDGARETLVDSRDLGQDVVIQAIWAPRSGKVFAFFCSEAGADIGKLRVLDSEDGRVLDELEGSIRCPTWLDDASTYYYIRLFRDEKTPDGVEPPADRVFLREDGRDEMVFGERLPTSHFISLRASSSGRKALLEVSYGWTRSTAYGGDFKDPGSWRFVYGGGDFIVHHVDFAAGGYILVSYENEGLGKLIQVRDGLAREIVGEHEHPLQEALVVGEHIVAAYLVDASGTLRTYALDGHLAGEWRPEPQGTLALLDSDGSEALIKYESFAVPYRLYALGRDDGLRLLDEVALDLAGKLAIRDRWARSKDGTPIHFFEARLKGAKPRGAVAYGYGGFGISITPTFNPIFVTLLEDGVLLAVVNLRGGCERGEVWHRAGMREKKQNIFEDFKAVLRALKGAGLRTVAFGRSNGGLLVGAVLTQEPGLMDGAVIGYPVLDMLRFHLLYVGRAWVPEYGDPDNPRDREFLRAYSPYHNVRPSTRYPPVFIYTGLHDDRVHPAHALKFAAKLRDAGADALLRVEMASGHAGASPEVKAREAADVLAYIYKVLGVTPS